MKIIESNIKLKRNETAIVLYPASDWSKNKIQVKQIGVNRFGKFYKREMFTGYNTFDDAISCIKKFNKYPPDYLIIERQIKLDVCKT